MKSFVKDLDQIVLAFRKGAFLAKTTALDVFFAYRLLLLRNPEWRSARELRRRTEELPDVGLLSRAFHASHEFRDKHYGQAQRPDGRVVLVREGNLRIAVHLDDLAISWAIINGCYEPEMRWLLAKYVVPGACCLDVGANVGYITANMADLAGPDGHVYSYEPFPTVNRLLRITVEESGLQERVTVREAACSDEETTTTMYFAAETDNFGGSFIAQDGSEVNAGLSKLSVPVTTLDKDLAGVPRIHFVKMDIEGAELRALRGMEARLRQDKPVLALEVLPEGLARQGCTPDDLLAFLFGLGYQVYRLSSLYEGNPFEITSESEVDFSPWDNIVCLPRE